MCVWGDALGALWVVCVCNIIMVLPKHYVPTSKLHKETTSRLLYTCTVLFTLVYTNVFTLFAHTHTHFQRDDFDLM